MSEIDPAVRLAEDAATALGPEGDLMGQLDLAGFGGSLMAVFNRAMEHPAEVGSAGLRLGTAVARIAQFTAARAAGIAAEPPIDPGRDKRFSDPAWTDNPGFAALLQYYLANRQFYEDMLCLGRGDQLSDAKASLATGFVLDALSPTNFLLTNPAALKRAFETGGGSLLAGARNFVNDLVHNNGRPSQVDRTPFTVGENMAATPGKVVFANQLMELIQYAPQTDTVHAIPMLASPPWINKYYIMDLAPGRSFIEWMVQHGHTVFAISYRNPDASMSGVTLDDYLVGGPQTALDVISDITGATKINITGLCLGGALTAMLAAYLNETGDDRLNSIALLNTMLDYSEPGVLGTFTDEPTVARLEQQMQQRGYLDGAQMSGAFDMLRANDLIFSYVASNWLMGKQPPAFDILAWNGDSTRMPAAMHSFYLRSLYIRNELAMGDLELCGQRLSLADIKQDTYVVGAINDHIVPWQTSYKATHLLGGHVRYVLSSGGHVAGIVNPPGPKAWYQAGKENVASAAKWREAAKQHTGSWWEDWTKWAGPRAGEQVAPPAMGSKRYPALADAPGSYVLG
ncbi:MAG TPA: alpha/beta fold hydrolase [Streptosporangiaceae bacterium]|nr:alpha/beta fold hydrolase [Streptosporangiaceae bacterium]